MTTTKNTSEALRQDWDKPPLGNIPLTENQRKVIKDKYLRDDPSVESWQWDIAKNIALAELLYHPEVPRDQLFTGIRYNQEWIDVGNGETTELLLLHVGAKNYGDQEQNHRKYIQNLYKILENNTKAREILIKQATQYYDILANFDFLPNSPTLMNASRELQQLSACYVLPIEDSIEA